MSDIIWKWLLLLLILNSSWWCMNDWVCACASAVFTICNWISDGMYKSSLFPHFPFPFTPKADSDAAVNVQRCGFNWIRMAQFSVIAIFKIKLQVLVISLCVQSTLTAHKWMKIKALLTLFVSQAKQKKIEMEIESKGIISVVTNILRWGGLCYFSKAGILPPLLTIT